jgi:hypothetical protein
MVLGVEADVSREGSGHWQHYLHAHLRELLVKGGKGGKDTQAGGTYVCISRGRLLPVQPGSYTGVWGCMVHTLLHNSVSVALVLID